MNTQLKIIILLAILFGIVYKQSINTSVIIDAPVVNPVVKPEPVPLLETNIVYDNLDSAIKLTQTHNRKLLLVFGADWCPYCKVLKKDISTINTSSYIVCIINTDKYTELVDQFKIKGLPTSIILTADKKEISRKTGYKKEEYNSWLQNNHMDVQASWIEK